MYLLKIILAILILFMIVLTITALVIKQLERSIFVKFIIISICWLIIKAIVLILLV